MHPVTRSLAPALPFLLAPLALGNGEVDISFDAFACVDVGDTVRVDLYATSAGMDTCAIAAIDVILGWDPAEIELIDHDNTFAGHPWMVTGFLPDPDGINSSTVDGDALFTALTSPSVPAGVPPSPGLIVTSFYFKPITPIPNGSSITIIPTMGTYGETAVYSFTTPGQDITGDISDVAYVFSCPIGTKYCAAATPNSSGSPGNIEAVGTPEVAENDLTLLASDLSLGSFGYFLCSRTQDFVPFPGGSQGILCLGDPVGRGVGDVIFNSGTTGTGQAAVDLNAMPQPTGPVVVVPGDTWNFQAWHRDANPGPTSNFTDAVEIVFF